MNLPLEHTAFERFVPHKGPMFLLDRLVGENLADSQLQAEVEIRREDLFFRPEMAGVPVWVGFEYMAQTIAALSGRQGAAGGLHPKVGFIMGIREFHCRAAAFPLGSCLRIEVSQEFRDGPVVSFRCRILDTGDSQELASAMVNAIEVDDTELNRFSEASNG